MRHKILSFCKYIKYLGILGLPSIFFEHRIFYFFWFFWLFGIVEIVLDYSIILQSTLQVFGIIIVKIRYGKNIPGTNNHQSNISYSLPFTGSWTVVNGGITKDFSHSWDIPSQRYAYDFVILDEKGKSHSGDAGDAKSYYCYGKEVLSPADGIVVEVYKNAKDSNIMGNGKADCKSKDIRGNYILINHADNEYSMLAHLQLNSILIKCGERVVRGQVIAKCGNTGNSSEPHLHFQLQNSKSFYFSAGLPLWFSYISACQTPNYQSFDNRPIQALKDRSCGFIMRGYNVFNNISRKEQDTMSDVEEKLAKSLTAESTELIPYLPYLLQDLWELGSSPKDIIDMIKKHIQVSKKMKVLDLACGKGAVSVQVAKTLGCMVKGIDIIPEFIDFAKKKAQENGVENLCEFKLGDINEEVKVENGYDIVILGAVADVLGNPEDTIQKLKNTVKDGGHIFIDDAYGNDNADGKYPTREKWILFFQNAGVKLLNERFNEEDDLKDLNNQQQSFIVQRANELKERYPNKAYLFDNYIKSQQAECDELENKISGVTMLLSVR